MDKGKKEGALHGEALEGHRGDGCWESACALDHRGLRMRSGCGWPHSGVPAPQQLAKGRRREPWHLSTRGGRPLPGEQFFHLHEAAQLPRACWAQVANSSPICGISRAGGGVPAGPAPLRCQPPPPPPWGAGTWWASPLGLPQEDARCWPCPPLGLCVLCLTG